jgi:hypothetical protein
MSGRGQIHKGSYRWYLQQLNHLWQPRGHLDYWKRTFTLVPQTKDLLRLQINETRKLLDALEAKLDETRSTENKDA